ncbi:MAG: o-succinylbenzoate synthase [Leptolyngbya sp. LCM1.Bin17]|nr:MAG: o-succinylbenzoate synthase [Leptolyngbya sp. LCM1.Bin17]
MTLTLAVKPYRRRFRAPLQTAHGVWSWRQGALVQVTDGLGRVAYGEIAPIPWFGSETLEDALDFCRALAGQIDATIAIPETLPATQFGLGSALAAWSDPPGDRQHHCRQHDRQIARDFAPLGDWPTGLAGNVGDCAAMVCGLLPAGAAMLDHWSSLIAQGHQTLKWKIGVFGLDQELAWLQQVISTLPPDGRLRLDANGGLTRSQAEQWLESCDRLNANPQCCTIEHVEQPLPPDQWPDLVYLSQRYNTAIALDESVATLPQLRTCHRQGWPGVYVVKPAIAGAPQPLQDFCRQCSPQQLVFSSVFETRIGRQAALALAAACYQEQTSIPALGFGTQGQFGDDWDIWPPSQIWEQLI